VYLDVLFLDAQRGFVVGAYGKFIATVDGGKTWTPGKPTDDEVHFNRIVQGEKGALLIAGESGTVLVSHDGGKKWKRSEVPYEGSLFAAVPIGAGAVVIGGLRGHILTSADGGAEWESHESDVKVLVMGGTMLKDGRVVLGGQGGNFFISRDQGKSFTHWKPETFGSSAAELVEADDGNLVVVGETGAVRLKLP
ncbi:MAG TPA: YCF48-related protein, partial [Candidatus Didemnitutus sp.]|nr:YCF48-related protein [Candidatus Didemnitutus sp.]